MTRQSDKLCRIRAVIAADTEEFSTLLMLSGLDPKTSFRSADLRRVDFGTADLSAFDLSHADVRGADFSRTTGIELALLDGLVFDRSTKGLPSAILKYGPNQTGAGEPYGAYNKAEAQKMVISGHRIPRDWVPFVTTLDLSLSDIDQLDFLSELVYLRDLNLNATPVSDIRSLSNLKNLQTLLLADTAITDLAPISNLIRLQRLAVNATNISDLAPLKGLSNLVYLDLSRTFVNDISLLQNLRKLRELYMSYTKVYDCRPLAGLEELQILDITDTFILRSEIKRLSIPITHTSSGTLYFRIRDMKYPYCNEESDRSDT